MGFCWEHSRWRETESNRSQGAGCLRSMGVFCPSHSRLIVFDAATNRVIFRMKLPNKSGRPALSPNGKHLAVLEHDRLEVFALPEK